MSRFSHSQGSNLRGGFITINDLKKIGDDPFGALADLGSLIQTGINKAAPYTSKIVGPLATALTGVPIPNPADFRSSETQIVDQAVNKGKHGIMKVYEKNDDIVQKLLDEGLPGTLTKAKKPKTKKPSSTTDTFSPNLTRLINERKAQKQNLMDNDRKYLYGDGIAILKK